MVLVLFATISTIMRPYYEIQRDIDKILTHMETQTAHQEGNTAKIDIVEDDVAILIRTIHTLLRIESGETVGEGDLKKLLEYFEEAIVYDDIKAAPVDSDGATSAIAKITQETLDALQSLQ